MFKKAKEKSVRFYDRHVVEIGSATKLKKQILGNKFKETDNDKNIATTNNDENVPINDNEQTKKQTMPVRELISVEHVSNSLNELTTIPEELHEIQPRPDQIWNCDEVGMDPNGKFSKIVYTNKWGKTKKVWRTQDG